MKFSFQSIYIALHVAYQWKSASAFAPVAFVAPSPNLQEKSCNAAHLQYGRQSFLQMAKAEDDYVKADDWEALQALFASHCDKDGLMTKSTLEKDISAIQGLLVSTSILSVFIVLLSRAPGYDLENCCFRTHIRVSTCRICSSFVMLFHKCVKMSN